jgi:HSP20 family molecular chaperone IbpA
MSQIAIHKCKRAGTISQKFVKRLEEVAGLILNRICGVFQHGAGKGSEKDNWLQAHLDVISSPAPASINDEDEFRARITLPGFDAQTIQVCAMPNALGIQAVACDTQQVEHADIRFCEFFGKTMFQRLELAAPIEVDKVSALLDQGLLEVTAPKALQKHAHRRRGF